MKTKRFSQPTEVVLASGLEHPQIYITNHELRKIKFSLFQGLLNPKWELFQNRAFPSLSLSFLITYTRKILVPVKSRVQTHS
jgi:hypothetical protein